MVDAHVDREDKALARNLARVVDVPQQSIVTFLKTRERSDRQKLQAVLSDLPDIQTTAKSSRDIEVSEDSGSVGSSNVTWNRAARARPFTEIFHGPIELKSSYEQFHSPSGKHVTKTPDQAFDGVLRKEVRDSVHKWRSSAQEDQVRILADTCRSLRWVTTQHSGKSSEYGSRFMSPGSDVVNPPGARTNSRNLSSIPIGSIYATGDNSVFRQRQKDQAAKMQEIMNRQEQLRQGTLRNKSPKKARGICAYTGQGPPSAKADKCFQEVSSSGNHKSEARWAWHADIHTHEANDKHANEQKARGFCTRQSVFQKRDVLSARAEQEVPTTVPAKPKKFINGGTLWHDPKILHQSSRLFP